MGIRQLAEAVILQSMEDVWQVMYKQASIEFFSGDGFKIYADAARMKVVDRLRLLRLLRRVEPRVFMTRHNRRMTRAKKLAL